MKVTNQKIHEGISFAEYLALPGWSYSTIKRNGEPALIPTVKMGRGTQVHAYLLAPEEFTAKDQLRVIKPMAAALQAAVGGLMRFLLPEIAVTATFSHNGFAMPYKGRIDLGIPNKLVIDFKITEINDAATQVKFFGYEHQFSGYGLGFGAQHAILINLHPKTLKTKTIYIPVTSQWWEYEVIKRGVPNL